MHKLQRAGRGKTMGRQGGLSLIELMVAMLLGTILIAGAISIYLASQRSYVESERAVIMGDGARFALMLLTDALRHTGFMAGIRGSDIETDVNLGAVANDCTDEGAAYNTGNFLYAVSAQDSDDNGLGEAFGCVDDALPNTDVLVVKYFLPEPLYDADPDVPAAATDGVISFPTGLNAQRTYVLANAERGLMIDGAESLANQPSVEDGSSYARAAAWPYHFQMFYVRAGVNEGPPALVRKFLAWDDTANVMRVETQDLVNGVENLRFRFGVDSDSDGEIDTFANLAQVTAGDDWGNVAFVEVFVLARSEDEDFTYTDEKVYQMGDLSYAPPEDESQFARQLISGGVMLRNPNLYLTGTL